MWTTVSTDSGAVDVDVCPVAGRWVARVSGSPVVGIGSTLSTAVDVLLDALEVGLPVSVPEPAEGRPRVP